MLCASDPSPLTTTPFLSCRAPRLSAEEEHASAVETDHTLRSRLQAAEQLIAAQAEELASVHVALETSTSRQEELEKKVSEHKQQDQYMRSVLFHQS